MTESQLRRLYPFAILVVGLVLFFPGLTASGLWDPYEIRIADAARGLLDHWSWGPQMGKPSLTIWLVAAGFKLFGIGELGGRLPIAITTVAALLAIYYAGAPLIGRRGAFFGALMLATTPLFLFGGRQLVSSSPLYLGAALAIGGLGRAAFPAAETSMARRLLDLLLGVAGLGIGQVAVGMLIGVLAPVGAVTVALLLSGGLGLGIGFLVVFLALAVRVAWSFTHATGYSKVLGGNPHAVVHTITIGTHLLRAGFQLFPWIALTPPAILTALSDDDDTRPEPRRNGGLVLVAYVAVLYLCATLHSAGVTETHAPFGVPLLLLAGAWIDHLLSDPTAKPLPFAAFTVGLLGLILGRDFFSQPQDFIAVHMLEPVRWPGPLARMPYVVMAFAGFWAGTIGLGVGVPLAPPGAPDEKRVKGRRLLLAAAGIGALMFGLSVAHWVIPVVSKQMSARDVYGKTKTLDPNAPIGQYHFNATGASYYGGNKAAINLETPKAVFDFLAKPQRVFVMAGSEDLPNLDQQARQLKATYYIIDDSNSRYLVLSNRLGPNEKDLNPLKRFISETPPKPEHVVEADFEHKVKLLGYDLPPVLGRGQEFKMRLYFQVLAPLGSNYKVFIHFDGPGTRFNGDHVPLEGRFPTQNWVPGYYITDEHLMAPDRATQPAGPYRLFMGFFAGDTRLKVVDGPQDGENRVKLGTVTIK